MKIYKSNEIKRVIQMLAKSFITKEIESPRIFKVNVKIDQKEDMVRGNLR